MSKRVKSDGSVQRALLLAIADPKMTDLQMGGYLTHEHLNQCDKAALMKIKEVWLRRWSSSQAGCKLVLELLDEFIRIRERQSPNYQPRSDDYSSVLGKGKAGPVPSKRPAGAAKPIEEVEKETCTELIHNLRKSMQDLDAGGQDPRKWLENILTNYPVAAAAEILLGKFGERAKSARSNRRWDILLARVKAAGI